MLWIMIITRLVNMKKHQKENNRTKELNKYDDTLELLRHQYSYQGENKNDFL
jgi:hypothetical protein